MAKLNLALAALVLSAAAPALAQENFIANPGFESGGDPTSFTGSSSGGATAANNWVVHHNSFGTTTTALVASTAPGGSGNALHVITNGGSNGVYQVTPQTFTHASADIFVNSGTAVFYAYTNAGNNAAGAIYISAGSGWQHVSIALPMDGYGYADSNEIVIYSAPNQSADFLVDNVYAGMEPLAPVPEPGEWAMLVAGLGVVGFAARRRKAA